MIALQMLSFFFFTWIISETLTKGVIAYFLEEWIYNLSAWLGTLLVGSYLFLESRLMSGISIALGDNLRNKIEV